MAFLPEMKPCRLILPITGVRELLVLELKLKKTQGNIQLVHIQKVLVHVYHVITYSKDRSIIYQLKLANHKKSNSKNIVACLVFNYMYL